MHSRNTPWNILLSCFSHHLTTIHLLPRQICKGSKIKLHFMKIHTEGHCPSLLRTCFWVQTPQVLQTLLNHTEGISAPQIQDQYPQLSTEDVGNAFSWHNSLTTHTFKYVQNIPVSVFYLKAEEEIQLQGNYMIYVADGTITPKSSPTLSRQAPSLIRRLHRLEIKNTTAVLPLLLASHCQNRIERKGSFRRGTTC